MLRPLIARRCRRKLASATRRGKAMVKRARKTRGVKRKNRPRRGRALTAAQIEHGLRQLFPELDDATIRDNRAALLPYLKRNGDNDDENEKIYDKPGEFGKYVNAHVAYVWLRDNEESYWKEFSFNKYDACDTIVFEAQYREVNVKCPPDGGFAALVRLCEKRATDMITLHECPDECGGSYFYTSYRQWGCQAGDILVLVQVTRMCYVT
jgi:hypothetical protein